MPFHQALARLQNSSPSKHHASPVTPLTVSLQRCNPYTVQHMQRWKTIERFSLTTMAWGLVLALLCVYTSPIFSQVFFGVSFLGLLGWVYGVHSQAGAQRVAVKRWLDTQPDVHLVHQLTQSPEHSATERLEALEHLERHGMASPPLRALPPMARFSFPAPRGPRWTWDACLGLGATLGMVLAGALFFQTQEQTLLGMYTWAMAALLGTAVARKRQSKWRAWKGAFAVAYSKEQLILFAQHPAISAVVQHALEDVLNEHHAGWSFELTETTTTPTLQDLA